MKPRVTPIPIEIEFRRKGVFLMAFVGILFSVILVRLMYMQVIKGEYYTGLSRNNRIRIMGIHAPRGRILDRNGIVLADNRPSYDLIAIPKDITDIGRVATRLSRLIGLNAKETAEKIRKGLRKPYTPVYLDRDITFEKMARVEAESYDLPGISIDPSTERDYVYKDLACHVLGFVGEISKKELDAHRGKGDYTIGDLIGKTGIELECEDTLRGKKGKKILEVDAIGRRQKVIEESIPTPGKDVMLTIDKRLQVIASDSLGNRAGAVVAIVPSTGEILAMVSKPGFDTNMFLGPIAPGVWKKVVEDPMHPLENRALRGQYPPGSIFKIFVALAGLSDNVIKPSKEIFCPGYLDMGSRRFLCWKREGHGYVDLKRAIIESCDVYFYHLGKDLGIGRIKAFANLLGLGMPTGIELPNEVSGLIPDENWKQRRFHRSWQKGETLITAIGQGYVLVTPLQVAKAMSAVVNGGYLYTPRIIASDSPRIEKQIPVHGSYLDIIKDAMRGVVEDPHGTGRMVRDSMFSIGGKTGTAQVVRKFESKRSDEKDIPYKYRDHAWFVGFSPVEKPEILVIAIVEHGGHGGSIAAPVVKDVIKGYYFIKGMDNENISKAKK